MRPITHGTITGYRRGCRCDACRASSTRHRRKYQDASSLRQRARRSPNAHDDVISELLGVLHGDYR